MNLEDLLFGASYSFFLNHGLAATGCVAGNYWILNTQYVFGSASRLLRLHFLLSFFFFFL